MSHILAIRHPGETGAGVLHRGAQRAGHSIEEWTPAETSDPPRPLDRYAALLVLGGLQNINEQDRFPYLTRELEVLDAWLAADRPAFGVCLGAQMIAHLRGGAVVPAAEREIGWFDVELLPAATRDPVLGFGGSRFKALLWHSYAVEPPAGAVALARNGVCLQAFRLGDTWAVQYHPEVGAEALDMWIADAERLDGADGTRYAAEISRGRQDHLPAWNSYGAELFRRFAARLE